MSDNSTRIHDLRLELKKCQKIINFFRTSARTDVAKQLERVRNRKADLIHEIDVLETIDKNWKVECKHRRKSIHYASLASGVMIFE
mmetsp:Transcript_5609/g.13037  ORF Transcript_5609/g.13037 Transcript_5609/m.13037 type:complete len:86 (-) Transcript_5609:99-356(-)